MVRKNFKDFFSENSADYSQYRPNYPKELFSYLSRLTKYHDVAWDCATGNGQSAIKLSDYFSKVIATDASHKQLESAVKKQGIQYQYATAENSMLDSNSIDLITVAQAFHWFDIDAFSEEVARVLKYDGIIAIWTYNLLSVNEAIDELIAKLYHSTLTGFWAFERQMVEDGYKNVDLPFKQIQVPEFKMQTQWNLSQLIGYLCTWSAVREYEQKIGHNPVANEYENLRKAWGNPNDLLQISWPLGIKIWQKTPR